MNSLSRGPFETLCDVISFLATVKEPEDDKVWTRTAEKLAATLDCAAAVYYAYLPKSGELIVRAALGTSGHRADNRHVAEGRGLCGWVAKYREPLVVENASSDPRYVPEVDATLGGELKRLLAVPLFDRLDLTGVLALVDKRPGPFGETDLALAAAACQTTSITLRALRLESTVDRVTAHNASILENLGGGFVAIDIHARLMLCNPAAKRILELSEDLPMGQPVDQVLAAIPEMSETLMDTLVKKETVKRQDLWWKRRGETRVLGYSTLLIQDPRGQVVGAGITFQDITQFQKKPGGPS